MPFAESIVIKVPNAGAAFAWHRDGSLKTGPLPERGVNFGIYLHASDTENGCLHVLPGSHRRGRIDLEALVEKCGHLPGALPVAAEPGDVVVYSRNLAHGSFANASPDLRVTVYFGYHARQTVEGIYAPEHIRQRMQVIPLAIGRRVASGLYVDEAPYSYRPLSDTGELGAAAQQQILRASPLAV